MVAFAVRTMVCHEQEAWPENAGRGDEEVVALDAGRHNRPRGYIMDETSSAPAHPSKKCPYCHIYLEIDAKRCYSCKRRVGRANRVGIARKPFDWLAYVICLLSWAAFGFYVWWAFLRK